ncbi:carbohydrate ABC transporter permease [Streptosporangiaceae bacterium NEAU-GS5]|nr:carbohydrate ABC transporter permease [Streptosporangiaceae bacterium NEAU-GS5]
MTVTLAPQVSAPRKTATARRTRGRAFLYWVAKHAVAIALGIMFVGPLVFIFLTAVMSDRQALTANLWPTSWHWENFSKIFTNGELLTWIYNTVLYSVLGTALMLVSSIPVAYALARFRFRGRKLAFLLVITTMMLPPQVVAVPIYIIWARFHLTGTLWPLIIPMLFGDAFSIFLLRQFLVTIPREYSDAAKVDGCGEFRTLMRVVLPMARPAIAAVALFQFFYCWNDYYGPLLYVGTTPDNWTLSVGLATFRAVHRVQWNLTMAATVLAMAPVIIVFFFAQRVFIEGVKLTGVK